MRYAIGIDLGGTNIKALMMDENSNILLERHQATGASKGSESVIRAIAEMIVQLQKQSDLPISAVGVTVPGVLRSAEGIVELLPNFPDLWKGVRLKEMLEREAGLAVHVLNDARAATYGEKVFGAAKQYANFICLVIGTGVGGGIVQNGELVLGSRGVGAELGHQVIVPEGLSCGCGNKGCLETVASGAAIIAAAIRYIVQGMPTLMRALVNGDLNRVTPALVNQAALLGDQTAISILEKTAEYLCMGIHNMIAVLNPQAVVIGGGVAKSELLLEMIRNGLKRKVSLFSAELGGVEVVGAKFDHLAGALGVAAWALHRQDLQTT